MLLFLLFLNFICFTFAKECHDDLGWMQVNESCYLVSPMKLSWFSAKEVNIFLKTLDIMSIFNINHTLATLKKEKKMLMRGC